MRVMKSISHILALAATISTTSALVINRNNDLGTSASPSPDPVSRQSTTVPAISLAQMISMSQATSCPPVPAGTDLTNPNTHPCRTAQQALQPIMNSFAKYGITTPAEQALLISTMVFESIQFTCIRPLSGAATQGTRNMMMVGFVREYATELGFNIAGLTDAQVLDKVNSDDDASFGSAAWYYTRHCKQSMGAAGGLGSQAGFDWFVQDCLGATFTAGRTNAWERAIVALNVPQS